MPNVPGAVQLVERQLERLGRVLCWLAVPLMLVVTYEVISRYVFNAPHSWSMDIVSWLMCCHFMMLSGYALHHDAHIRMDVIYGRLSDRWKAVADSVGYCLLFLPFVAAMMWASVALTKRAWSYHEMTANVPQLPVYVVKTFVPLSMFLLLVNGVLKAFRAAWFAARGERL